MFNTKQSFLFALSISLSACFVSFSTTAQSSISAFRYSTDATPLESSSRDALVNQTVETWPITLNAAFRQLNEGGAFNVSLPNGATIDAEVTNRIEYENGDIQLIATINTGGSIVITMGDGVAFGSINNDSVSYSIGLDNNKQIALVDNQSIQNEIDLSDDMRFPPINTSDRSTSKPEISLEDLERLSARNTGESTIDLLVVYSSEFATLFGTPNTRINQLVSFTNTSFADSGILINLRLVGAVELGFDNTSFETSFDQVFAELGVILNNSTNGVGDFTNLPALRNQYGADLVAVLNANTNNSAAAGLAWVLNGGENPTNAVSTTMLSSNGFDSVFAHELGHNLGSNHQITDLVDGEDGEDDDCNGGYTGFSCGYTDSVNEFATIMSSGGNKSVVGYLFSNTDSDCLGSTCGLAGSADNRTSFNMSRLIVAEFGDEVISSTPTTPGSPTNFDSGWLPAILFNLLENEAD